MPFAILHALTASAADEAVPSAGVYGAASTCAPCLVYFGVDPAVAGPVAVLGAIVLRPIIDDVWQYVKARWLRWPPAGRGAPQGPAGTAT